MTLSIEVQQIITREIVYITLQPKCKVAPTLFASLSDKNKGFGIKERRESAVTTTLYIVMKENNRLPFLLFLLKLIPLFILLHHHLVHIFS
jgi:hypothetical protein